MMVCVEALANKPKTSLRARLQFFLQRVAVANAMFLNCVEICSITCDYFFYTSVQALQSRSVRLL